MNLSKGNKAPDFTLKNQENIDVSLADFQGRWLVLYFYPKDNTSGCTREAIDFTGMLEKFDSLNAVIVGISPDTVKSHVNFINKHDLKITLLSDPDHQVLAAYDAWGKKRMYGREYEGVIRSTVLIDPSGNIADYWEKVKVAGHAESVSCSLVNLQET